MEQSRAGDSQVISPGRKVLAVSLPTWFTSPLWDAILPNEEKFVIWKGKKREKAAMDSAEFRQQRRF